jgi:hypothetical protein
MLRNITDVAPFLADEKKAGDFIQKLRWPDGVNCAFCGHVGVYSAGDNSLIGLK